jgi:proteasome accessory factor PafA2
VAIPKVCGIETEYGVRIVGGDNNPIAASSLLINAYSQLEARRRTGWDFEDETPGKDARGFVQSAKIAEIETNLINCVLLNGARYYVDHAHPEYSTPECLGPLEAVVWDKAGEIVLRRSMQAARDLSQDGTEVVVYKNNSDRKGNSYGCHENYLVSRAVPFPKIVERLVPHLVTRQIYTGAGKLGCETKPVIEGEVFFQLTQRADFFEEVVGLETTIKRPIVNTRDEPHANPEKYRRLHIIVGDANLSQVATFLKLGTTAVLLAMLEDEVEAPLFQLDSPVKALKLVSQDLTLRAPLELRDGRSMTALEIQGELLGQASRYLERAGHDAIGGEEQGKLLLRLWEGVLEGLAEDPESLADQIDWVAKLRLIEAFKSRGGASGSPERLAAIDLQYHDLREDKGLAGRLPMMELVDKESVEAAVTEPPPSTRAYFRGKCLARFHPSIVTANWDSLVFDVGEDPLRRVPMMDPLKGSRDLVEDLIMECKDAKELLAKLEA